jgi:hypothetical protein
MVAYRAGGNAPQKNRESAPMPVFEITVFNQAVRDKLKAGERHREFKDEWADPHYVEISAQDEPDVRRKAAAKFPAEQGFVIVAVTET